MNVQYVSCYAACFLMVVWIWTQRRIIQESNANLLAFNNEISSAIDLKEDPRFTTTTLSPEEMKRRRLNYQKTLREQSDQRLKNMTEIRRQNSHKIPTISAFGTQNSSTICQGTDLENCPPKFKMLEASLRFSRRYKLLACLIQKSMSTMLQAAMCFLHSEQRFLEADRQINQESYSRRFCQWKNELNLQHQGLHVLNKTTGIELSNDWMYMAIVRDPIDRFLSAFVDKCIRWPRGAQCNNCKANMTCFVQQEYKRMMEEGKKNRLERSWEDRHFFAQNWYCDFRSNYDKYNFIHYSNNPNDFDNFLKEFSDLLKKRGIPETSIEYIMSQLKGGRTTNSTIQSEARQYFEKLLRSSPYIMEYILRMYYHDFQLFHFKMPVFSFG